MKQLVEEKDKHINDLTETLNNFHEDQQRYIKDSSSYSAEQISKCTPISCAPRLQTKFTTPSRSAASAKRND
ncbi:unnamed protein product [Ceratitis capitata]|uniref:(Mediterranean fruit fly) hypothetical protein n=1 Tax=Ceratitis capitata TaxID=7213 RepID=A0A811V1Q2_CERCA|nr:unnamed protein product [Ceratitis capitata]